MLKTNIEKELLKAAAYKEKLIQEGCYDPELYDPEVISERTCFSKFIVEHDKAKEITGNVVPDVKQKCSLPGVYISDETTVSIDSDSYDVEAVDLFGESSREELFNKGSGVGYDLSSSLKEVDIFKQLSERGIPVPFSAYVNALGMDYSLFVSEKENCREIKELFVKAGRRGKFFSYYNEIFNKTPVTFVDQNGKEYTKGTDIVWNNPIRLPELSPLDIKKMTGANVGEEIKPPEPVACVNGDLEEDERTTIYEYEPHDMLYRSPVDHLFQLADVEDLKEGHCVFVLENSYLYMYDGSKWVAFSGPGKETEKEIKSITGNSCRIKFD